MPPTFSSLILRINSEKKSREENGREQLTANDENVKLLINNIKTDDSLDFQQRRRAANVLEGILTNDEFDDLFIRFPVAVTNQQLEDGNSGGKSRKKSRRRKSYRRIQRKSRRF